MAQADDNERLPRPISPVPGPRSTRRIDGPTPHGGAYLIIIERPGSNEKRVEIVEYDENDHPIFRTYGRTGKRS